MSRPTILQIATRIGSQPGFDMPTPRWSATLAYLYGLPLSDTDVDELVAATHRSRDAIIAHARRVMGRKRFRQLWARVGRRGRKSSTAALVSVYEAVWGAHEAHVLPGEQALVVVQSKDIAGANVIARFQRMYLDALGIKHSTTRIGAVSVTEIESCQIGLATLAATTDAPRGFAVPVLIEDEFAHAPDGEEYIDNAKARLDAAEPAMLQFPEPLLIGISTPLGCTGEFHNRVERGLGNDDEETILAVEGPTWEWSPELTLEQCQALEQDDDTFSRELGAKPSPNEGTAYVPADVERCFRPITGIYHWGRPFMTIDAAETVNTFAYCLASWGQPSKQQPVKMVPHQNNPSVLVPARDRWGRTVLEPAAEKPMLRIFGIGGWTGEELRQLGMTAVIAELARIAKNAGAEFALSDRYAAAYVAALLSEHQVKVRSFVHTSDSKHESVTLTRTLMRDGEVSIEDHEGMRRDLKTYPRTVSGGRFVYGKRRGNSKHHWDYASLLVTLGHALIEDSGTNTEDTHFRIENAPTRKRMFPKHWAPGAMP